MTTVAQLGRPFATSNSQRSPGATPVLSTWCAPPVLLSTVMAPAVARGVNLSEEETANTPGGSVLDLGIRGRR